MQHTITVDNEITVRPTLMSDAPLIFDAFSTQGNYLRQWLPIAADFNTLDDVCDYIENCDCEGIGSYSIVYNGQFAGHIAVKSISYLSHISELGYWLTKPLQGRGIMTRSVQTFINQLFTKTATNRLVIKCAVGNERSRRIPIRLNFKLEGVERDGEMSADGHYNDLEVFSLLKSEYEQLINQKS